MTYSICDSPLRRVTGYRNCAKICRCYVWIESVMIFVPARKLSGTVWTKPPQPVFNFWFFQLILGSRSSLIDQNLLFTDHTLSSTWLLNYISNYRIDDSVGQYITGSNMIGTLNVGRDEAEGRRAIEVKLHLASFISVLVNLLWPVTAWIKEAFLLLSWGWFFFFLAKYSLHISASSLWNFYFFKLKKIKKIPASMKCDGFISMLEINSTYYSASNICGYVVFLRKPAPTTTRTSQFI